MLTQLPGVKNYNNYICEIKNRCVNVDRYNSDLQNTSPFDATNAFLNHATDLGNNLANITSDTSASLMELTYASNILWQSCSAVASSNTAMDSYIKYDNSQVRDIASQIRVVHTRRKSFLEILFGLLFAVISVVMIPVSFGVFGAATGVLAVAKAGVSAYSASSTFTDPLSTQDAIPKLQQVNGVGQDQLASNSHEIADAIAEIHIVRGADDTLAISTNISVSNQGQLGQSILPTVWDDSRAPTVFTCLQDERNVQNNPSNGLNGAILAWDSEARANGTMSDSSIDAFLTKYKLSTNQASAIRAWSAGIYPNQNFLQQSLSNIENLTGTFFRIIDFSNDFETSLAPGKSFSYQDFMSAAYQSTIVSPALATSRVKFANVNGKGKKVYIHSPDVGGKYVAPISQTLNESLVAFTGGVFTFQGAVRKGLINLFFFTHANVAV